MTEFDLAAALGPALASALEKKGYADLTSVQRTVLDPALVGRDLRITSQTGSGKTLAVGFALRDLVEGPKNEAPQPGPARPKAIVVAPTRELARQVEEELSWLYAPLGARVASVTGGASYRDERRELGRGPAVIVGTPGRLLDHLERGSIDASGVGAIVLDEADRMLDLGFREELEAILSRAPEDRRTHLVSATFPRDVRGLADRVQRNAAHVEGTRLGVANVDIDHVLHVVAPEDRVSAVVNLLLANPGEQTLVFARTRADVAGITRELAQAGFSVSSLSGEMDQPERNRALAGFRSGALRVLVATDVAARGIDVQDIGRVVHVEPPTDADTYTHRSGRTGRAGRKGTSSLLVAPGVVARATRLVERTGATPRFEPIPSADTIRGQRDDRLFEALTGELTPEDEPKVDARTLALAARCAEAPDAARTFARLLSRLRRTGHGEPRDIRPMPTPRAAPARAPRDPSHARRPPLVDPQGDHARRPPLADPRDTPSWRPPRDPRDTPSRRPPPFEGQGGEAREAQPGFRPFHVTWGELHGADARRLLAVVCRRGDIRGADVGAIRVGPTWSVVEVAEPVADSFAIACQRPDPRNPRIAIRPEEGGAPPREARRPRTDERPRHASEHDRGSSGRDHGPREQSHRPPPDRRDEGDLRPPAPRRASPERSRPMDARAAGPVDHGPRARSHGDHAPRQRSRAEEPPRSDARRAEAPRPPPKRPRVVEAVVGREKPARGAWPERKRAAAPRVAGDAPPKRKKV